MSRQEKLKARGATFQHELGKEVDPKLLCRIPRGTMVWPERGGRGMTQHDVLAEKLPNKKICGLQAFKLLNPVDLYLDGRFRTLPTGSKFGTYARNTKRVRK